MKGLRLLLGDRLSTGVLAGTTAWLLAVNLFVAAFSCGMSVPVAAGERFVLCEPGQLLSADDDDAAEPSAHFTHDCPYVIGHDGDALLVADVTPGADLGPAFGRAEPIRFAPSLQTAAPIDPGRLGLVPAPRGPPLSV